MLPTPAVAREPLVPSDEWQVVTDPKRPIQLVDGMLVRVGKKRIVRVALKFRNVKELPVIDNEKPNPGSNAALDIGCLCPVLDNGHGRGCGRYDEQGKPLFWIAGDCPLHAPKPPAESEANPV